MYSTKQKMPDGMRKWLHISFFIFVVVMLYFINLAFEGRGCSFSLFDRSPDSRQARYRQSRESAPGSGFYSTGLSETSSGDSGQQSNPLSSIEYSSSEGLFAVFAMLNVCGYDSSGGQYHPVRKSVREALFSRIRDGYMPSYDILNTLFAKKRINLESAGRCMLNRFAEYGLSLSKPPDFQVLWPSYYSRQLPELAQILSSFYREGRLDQLWTKYQDQFGEKAGEYRPITEAAVGPYVRCMAMNRSFTGMTIYSNLLGEYRCSEVVTMGQKRGIVFGSQKPSQSIESFERVSRAILFSYFHHFLEEERDVLKKSESLFSKVKKKKYIEENCAEWRDVVAESMFQAMKIHCNSTRNSQHDIKKLQADGLILTGFFVRGYQEYPRSGKNFTDFIHDWLKGLPFYSTADKS